MSRCNHRGTRYHTYKNSNITRNGVIHVNNGNDSPDSKKNLY